MMQKKISIDSIKLDSFKVVKDTACCLTVSGVAISKAGVYDYSDSPVWVEGKPLTKALKSAAELLKATRTVRATKLVILEHPSDPMPVVTGQEQMKGHTSKPFFDGTKGRNGVIRTSLNFDKQEISKEFIQKIIAAAEKIGPALDVSIGFYHEVDPTSGVWHDDEKGVDVPYEYIMRNMVIDHVAVGVGRGRCSYPDCGIGADSVPISVDALLQGKFSRDYPTMEACLSDNKDKQNPELFCQWYMKQTGKIDIVAAYDNKKMIAKSAWEETKEYIRSGHGNPEQIDNKVGCRTTDLNGKLPDEIKAVYCKRKDSDEWFIQSYLFPKSKFTMSQAKVWFEKHKGDAMSKNEKLKDEFVKMKVKEGLTKEQALEQYEDLTKSPELPEGSGEETSSPGQEEETEEEESAVEPPAVEPTVEQTIEKAQELRELITGKL